jgi:hypothetical protein
MGRRFDGIGRGRLEGSGGRQEKRSLERRDENGVTKLKSAILSSLLPSLSPDPRRWLPNWATVAFLPPSFPPSFPPPGRRTVRPPSTLQSRTGSLTPVEPCS